jgi:hypothetical protein
LLDVRRIQLSDPSVPESTQPYHSALQMHKAAGDTTVARLTKIVDRFARKSLDGLFAEYAARRPLVGAGIVVGSEADPATIGNEHIRAHAEEGRLFRLIVSDAAARAGLTVQIVAEKHLFDRAAELQQRSVARIKADLTLLGRDATGSWRAEHKAAALGAWILLA